jgi:uncharacterized membrane protein HdeD (DUF308 family)
MLDSILKDLMIAIRTRILLKDWRAKIEMKGWYMVLCAVGIIAGAALCSVSPLLGCTITWTIAIIADEVVK